MRDRLRRARRRIARLLSPAPAILLYHRVSRPAFDPWGLAVTPEDFDAQIAWLARHRRPMSMDAFVAGLDRGRLPRGAVAITFDDGYLDNLLHAKPVLERHGVPATLFLATGYVSESKRFWWDQLADAVLASPGAADWTLAAGGEQVELRWGAEQSADPAWRAWQPPSGPRERAFLKIWTLLQRLPEDVRRATLREVETRLPAPFEAEARALREPEVYQLLAGGSFSLGAHSVTHPALTALDEPDLRTEVDASREACERLQGRPPSGFAYPYGDMSASVRAVVAAAGFQWACSTEAASPPLRPSMQARLALPRLVPPPGGGNVLARILRGL